MKFRTAVLSFVLFLPVAGYSQTTLNFPRVFPAAELAATGFAVVNPGPTAATVTFTIRNAAGQIVGSPSNMSVPARGQRARLGTPEIFTSVAQDGWIQATSSTVGLTGFWVSGDFSTFMDGAEAAPSALELIFPLATNNTELNVANATAFSNSITIRIHNSAGAELASAVQQNLQGNGAFKGALSSIFPAVNFADAMYVRVTGTSAITGSAVTRDFLYAPSSVVNNGIDASLPLTEANFPHIASGASGGTTWTAMVGITNLSNTVGQTVTFSFTPKEGVAVTAVQQRVLQPRGSLRETVQSIFGFTGYAEGWVKVTGTAPLNGYIAYGEAGTKGVATVPVQAFPQSSLIFAHVGDEPPTWWTGLALLNPTGTAANVEVYVLRPDPADSTSDPTLPAVLVGGARDTLAAAFTMPGGSNYVKLLSEIVPSSLFNGGFVYVKSTNNVPLYGLQLFFTRDLQVISNIAAGTIDSSITFTPPAPAIPLPTPDPTVTSLSPGIVARGANLTVTGTDFNTTAGNNRVVFTTEAGSEEVTPSAGSATSLTVAVPNTATSGPVYVKRDTRFSSSQFLTVTQNSTTPVMSSVSVGASQTAIADIYVTGPAGATAINTFGLAVTDVSALTANVGGRVAEIQRGDTKRLWLSGDGISASEGLSVSISGSDVTVTFEQASDGVVIVRISVSGAAATGPRNILVTDSDQNMSVITGGLIIR